METFLLAALSWRHRHALIATSLPRTEMQLGSHNAICVVFNNVFFRIPNQNRRTLRCKTRSGCALTENRNFGKKPQKTRPKKKRGKNLIKTTEVETRQTKSRHAAETRRKTTTQAGSDFIDRKKPIGLDKNAHRENAAHWELTCQHMQG